jgi:hypothetical protein
LGGTNAVTAVYVLTTTNGLISRAITDTAGAAGDYFGYSIAYLFDTGTGALLQSFTEPSPAAQDKFGSSVAIISRAIAFAAVMAKKV